MSVRHEVSFNQLDNVQAALRSLNGKAVEIGVFNGEQAWLAHIHEFGFTIPVTEKMRQYLHSTGLHLKASTTSITIPERAFLRGGYEKAKRGFLRVHTSLLGAALNGLIDADTYLDAVGTNIEGCVKEYAVSLSSPELHPYTIENRKNGGSNPLVDTGSMIGAISHRVV